MKQEPRGRYTIACLTIGITFCMIVAGLMILFSKQVHGAELALPNLITHGRVDRSMSLKGFGTYGLHYYQRRWKRMCAGGGRYVAMAEANDLGKPQPCN